MERARDAGITFAAVRDIMSAHEDDGPDGESFGRMVERIRDLALQAAAQMAAEERAAVVAYLRRIFPEWPAGTNGYADEVERGEHRPGGYPANNKKFAEKVQEQLRRDDKADQFRSNMSRFATSLRKDSSAQNLMDEHQMDNIQRGERRRGEGA